MAGKYTPLLSSAQTRDVWDGVLKGKVYSEEGGTIAKEPKRAVANGFDTIETRGELKS